jgi:hypothetical protein
MDEPEGASILPPVSKVDIVLSPEQRDTTALLQRLFGRPVADRYTDFCRLASGASGLRVSRPMAAHALRELESMLRQALEAPFDARSVTNPSDPKRVNEIKSSMQRLGFNADAIRRALSGLEPRVNHKTQIIKIAERLGLAADSDIARAWVSLCDSFGKAHQRSFHHSLEVDDEFRSQYQVPFETVIRAIATSLQIRYDAFMQRVEQLTVMPNRQHAVALFAKEIPGALPLQWHFFGRLETPDWLQPLAANGFLAAPPPLADDAFIDGMRFRQWPAGNYLLRMARSEDPSARKLVAQALREVAGSKHPDVQYEGMQILAALPAEEAAPLVDVAADWLTPEARFQLLQAPHDLIRNLALGGQADAAFLVAGKVFQLFEHGGRLATLFSQHMYEHFLPSAVKQLADLRGEHATTFFCDLLMQAATISRKFAIDPPSDHTTYSFEAISEDGVKHDVFSALIGAVVRAAKIAINADPTRTTQIVSRIRSFTPKIFTRIALHVLAHKPDAAPDLAESYLCEKDFIDSSWCRDEYAQLALAWYPSLSSQKQQQILTFVDAIPDQFRDRWKARFESHTGNPPTEDDIRRFDASTVRDILWRWRDALSVDRQQQLDTIARELGDPDAWKNQMLAGDTSPLTSSDFSTQPIPAIISFLQTWEPGTDARSQTVTALAKELGAAAQTQAKLYSGNATLFGTLAPVYIRNLLSGLQNAAINSDDLGWSPIVDLASAVIARAKEPLGFPKEGHDPDWIWTLRAAAELLAAGLRKGADGIGFENAPSVTRIVLDLVTLAPRQPETNDFEESYRKAPYFAVQSTLRGLAVELCILLVFWLSKDTSTPVGKNPRQALAQLPEITKAFTTALSDQSATGRVPRAILGRFLQWLFYFGEDWLKNHWPQLFPPDDQALRDAAWLSHLVYDAGPVGKLMPQLHDCYAAQISRLQAEKGDFDQTSIEDRLADYVVVLYIEGIIPDELIREFWRCAPARVLQHAIWFLSTQLELPPDRLPDTMRIRAQGYWEQRLAEAKNAPNPDEYRDELGSFGQFFFRGQINDNWLMKQLMELLDAGFVPQDAFSVVDRLAKISPKSPDRAAHVLAAMLLNPRLDRWAYTTQGDAIRSVFEKGLAEGSTETVTLIKQAASYLASVGETSYLLLIR